MQKTHVLFLSIPSMNFTFQKIMLHKHYVRAKIIQSLIASNRSTTYSSDIYLVSLGNLAHFCLVIWHTIIVIPPYIAHPTLRQTYPLLSWKYLIVLPIRAILLQLQSPPKSSFLLFYGLACSLRKHPARYSALLY